MKQTVHPRGGWQQEENDLLFAAVKQAAAEGKPLRDVFAKVGEELHRKPNSIRNYYYAKVKDEPELAPSKATFRAFDQEELHLLLRDVLMAKGRGESVRACVIRRANGDRSAMLRYQNKYRSILKNRPELLMEVADELRREGLPCPENVVASRHYTPSVPGAVLSRMPVGWEKEAGVAVMLEGLGMLLRRMEAQTAALRERAEAVEAAQLETGDEAEETAINELLPRVWEPSQQQGTLGLSEETVPAEGKEKINGQRQEAFEQENTALTETPLFMETAGMSSHGAYASPVLQVPYDKWLKTRHEADRLRVEVDLLKIALEEAEKGKVENTQE